MGTKHCEHVSNHTIYSLLIIITLYTYIHYHHMIHINIISIPYVIKEYDTANSSCQSAATQHTHVRTHHHTTSLPYTYAMMGSYIFFVWCYWYTDTVVIICRTYTWIYNTFMYLMFPSQNIYTLSMMTGNWWLWVCWSFIPHAHSLCLSLACHYQRQQPRSLGRWSNADGCYNKAHV